jgi:hypothetical protein
MACHTEASSRTGATLAKTPSLIITVNDWVTGGVVARVTLVWKMQRRLVSPHKTCVELLSFSRYYIHTVLHFIHIKTLISITHSFILEAYKHAYAYYHHSHSAQQRALNIHITFNNKYLLSASIYLQEKNMYNSNNQENTSISINKLYQITVRRNTMSHFRYFIQDIIIIRVLTCISKHICGQLLRSFSRYN